MAKSIGIAGVLAFFFNRNWSLERRGLSSDEVKLLEHYRALSEHDRVAMRYLVDAMRNVSRF
ncbi:hypothetical protein OOJ96_08195 [Pseudomonas sp. 15FMM2]|uniref:Uncharacterized protein n=1 Tax=Pseudomonas imrae TaxID=2992837 RepID=A0ACC7PAR3_9PSED